MADWFYRTVRFAGHHVFWVSARATVLHAERAPRQGPGIVVCNHHSPFEVPLLIHHVPALIDFVSITELFARPMVGRFFAAMNAFPLERSRPDPITVRRILHRLARGRLVSMFPEGRVRAVRDSVTQGGSIGSGVVRIARLAAEESECPIYPCVVLGSGAYRRPAAWLPRRAVRYGINFGEAISPRSSTGLMRSLETIQLDLADAFRDLSKELEAAIGDAAH